jgi:preprotein translocase subunit SecG
MQKTEMQIRMRIILAAIFFVIALIFVLRSFYGMRVPAEEAAKTTPTPRREPVGAA